MNNFKFRWRYLFVPYLVITLGSAIGYSFLYWLVVVKFRWIDWDERVTHWVLPCAVAVVLVLIFLYRRIHLFDVHKKQWDLHTNYLIAGFFLVAAPVVAFQYFTEDITGELRVLQTPEEIEQHKPVKYYIVQQHRAGKYNNRREEFVYDQGSKRNTLELVLVIGVPLYSPGKEPPQPVKITPIGTDTSSSAGWTSPAIVNEEEWRVASSAAPVWLCWQYKTTFNRGLSMGERENVVKGFYRQSMDSFYHQNPDGFVYLRRPGNNRERDRFAATIRESYNGANNFQPFLEPVYKPYEDRYLLSMVRAILILVIASLLWFILVAFPRLDKDAVNKLLEKEEAKRNPPVTFRGYI